MADVLLLFVPTFVGLIVLDVIYSSYSNNGYYRFNDTINNMSHGMISRIGKAYTTSLLTYPYHWIHQNWRLTDLGVQPDTFLKAFLLVLAVDLAYYWAHRIAHMVNLFWGGHKTHHSGEDYNLSTALRQSAFEDISGWMFFVPLAFFFDFNVFRLYFDINLVWQFWVHTKHLKRGPWWFELVFVTPSHHRVHHASNPVYIDANFGGFLIIWDRLFGTFISEKDEVEPVYGITDPVTGWNPVYSQISHWRYLWSRIRRFPKEGILAKLQVIFYGPGWSPKNKSYYPVRPVSVETFVKYDPFISLRVKFYVFYQFVSTLALALYSFAVFPSATLTLIPISLLLLFSLACQGKLMEGHLAATRGRIWEVSRLLSLLSVSVVWPFTGILSEASQTWALPCALYSLSSLFWFFLIHPALNNTSTKTTPPSSTPTIAAVAATPVRDPESKKTS